VNKNRLVDLFLLVDQPEKRTSCFHFTHCTTTPVMKFHKNWFRAVALFHGDRWERRVEININFPQFLCEKYLKSTIFWVERNWHSCTLSDFNIPYVNYVIHKRINKHQNKFEGHPNLILEPLLQPMNTWRLKRRWPLDFQST